MRELTEAEQELADKLADAGPTQERAEEWVREVVDGVKEYDNLSDAELLTLAAEANEMLPFLRIGKQMLRKANLEPSGVMMPARFNVRYVGEHADNDFKGTFMQLPIAFSSKDEWGLIVKVEKF